MKKLLLIIFILLLFGQNTFAQTPHFRNYTVDDGLPSSHVYRAFQDSKGFMWFCTDKGLARFDGYKFEKFTTKNGLPNNDIWQCAEDSQQRIWFLSYANAFFYFDLKDGKFHVIDNPFKDIHDAHVWCYVEDGKDKMRVILSNYKVLYVDVKINKVDLTNKKYVQEYPLVYKKDYLSFEDSRLADIWHLRAYSESLQHNILHKKHIIPEVEKIDFNIWRNLVSLIFDNDRTIYSTNNRIIFYENNIFRTKLINQLSNYKNDNLSLILNAGNNGKKLIITDQDIFIINQKIERLKEFDFIKQFNVNTVFFDFDNNFWLCTKNNGVFLLSNKSVNSKSYEQFSKQSITTITKDTDGKIWLGNNLGELFHIKNDGIITQQFFREQIQIPVKQIVATSTKGIVLWNNSSYAVVPNFKNGNNLIKLKNIYPTNPNYVTGKTTTIIKNVNKNEAYIFKKQNVKTINVDLKNNILLGTSSNIRVIDDNVDNYTFKYIGSGILTFKVLAILPTKGDSILIGTNKGLEIINRSEKLVNIKTLKKLYPILTKPISSFTEDNQGALWTGTDGYGVYRLLKNKVLQIPELAGIIVNHLYFEKENNRLFVSTNEGIFVLKLNSKGLEFTYSIQKISLAQGLPTLEVNAVVVRNQELFVATSKGLALLPLQSIDEGDSKNIAMPLLIKNIKINRRDTTISQRYDLNYRQNNLDIDFVALSYKSDKNIKYDYKMLSSNDNSDTAWHSVQDLHKEFSLLSPGKYEFRLRAFDIDGYPSKPIQPIIFVINPPFWQTLWFKFLLGLLLFSIILIIFYIRTRNIKKKEQEKTEVNKKFAELELQALQAQMNPHFVFNALSAIQNFILNNNTEEATDYLSRFSRLMRLFLESSRNKYIALSDEKTLLEHYIKLEELRFKDKFSSEIRVDENVSLDTEIPSMLLQPFVENAINHGLVYKEKNDGMLNINFCRSEDKLVCVIEDNGIGRAKAAEIKNKSLKPYKSRSTEITEDRLRSLELIENTKIEIDILDKTDKNDAPIGTKVTIVMYL